MPGYLGSGPEGEVVTLGRGGSDFSAAILARSVGARSVTLFKEVDGLMTADPKSVPSARQLSELHYREAAELAFYGAKVLHPRTMIPLVDRKIPLFVRNTFREHSPGTRIADDVKPGAYPVKALTAIHRQSLISIEGSGMIGVPGVAGRAFTALSQAGHSVSMISQASSEVEHLLRACRDAEAAHAVAALEEAFAPGAQVEAHRPHPRRETTSRSSPSSASACAAVPASRRARSRRSAARGVNVVAIAQGSSELNITVAVAEEDATRALQALHSEYQLDKLHPLADTSGRESKLTLLGFGQIGRELAAQLAAQEKHLRSELGIDVKVTAVADRSGIRIDEKGFTPAALQKLAKQKASGTRLFDRRLAADARRAADDDARGAVDPAVAPADPRRPHVGRDRAADPGSARERLPHRAGEQETAGRRADRVRPADGDGAKSAAWRCATKRPPARDCRCSTRWRSCRKPATASRRSSAASPARSASS